MKLLLDTHIWLWLAGETERPSRAVKRQIEKHSSEVYLSPVSIWEAYHVARKGSLKLKRKQGFSAWLSDTLARMPVKEAPFNFAVAAETARIHLPQSDLGDLFLAATASVFDLTLVTADPQLIACPGIKTLADE